MERRGQQHQQRRWRRHRPPQAPALGLGAEGLSLDIMKDRLAGRHWLQRPCLAARNASGAVVVREKQGPHPDVILNTDVCKERVDRCIEVSGSRVSWLLWCH